MQVQIESFSDYKKTDRGPSAKIKTTNGDLIYINEEPAPLVGKTVDIDVNEKTSQKGNRYKVGKITKVYEATAANNGGNNNGKITWDDYRRVAEAAHSLAKQLEPDEWANGTERQTAGEDHTVPVIVADRAPARVGFVNVILKAYAEGRFIVPKDDEEDAPF